MRLDETAVKVLKGTEETGMKTYRKVICTAWFEETVVKGLKWNIHRGTEKAAMKTYRQVFAQS